MKTATSNRQLKLERPFIVFFYRLFARWLGSMKFLLLTTTGRKSGRKRTVPLVYMPVDGAYAVIAANVGLDAYPGWFLNVKQSPQAHVQIGSTKMEVAAEEAETDQRERLWTEWIKANPGYAQFQAKTTRKFSFVVLKPVKSG